MDIFTKKGSFYFIVMDNVGFHKCPAIINLYNRKHHHTLLPPYSPFLNPIEYVFSQWKTKFKRLQHRNDEEVAEAIDKSSEELQEDLSYFFKVYNHVKKYYPRVLNFESID